MVPFCSVRLDCLAGLSSFSPHRRQSHLSPKCRGDEKQGHCSFCKQETQEGGQAVEEAACAAWHEALGQPSWGTSFQVAGMPCGHRDLDHHDSAQAPGCRPALLLPSTSPEGSAKGLKYPVNRDCPGSLLKSWVTSQSSIFSVPVSPTLWVYTAL